MTHRELEGVEPTILTCDQVDERDLEAGYLAGRLTEAEAEAFEAHLFGCDRCWSRLQLALAVAGSASGGARAAQRRRWLVPSLAAAAALVVVVGVGRWVTSRGPAAPETLRGPDDALVVEPTATPTGVAVRFGHLPGADRYRVRVYSEAGALLAQRETADTTVDVTLDPGVAAQTPVLIQVTALDALSEPLASSRLVRLDRASPPR